MIRCLTGLMMLALASPVIAIVEIGDVGQRYELIATSETVRSVMNTLAERFEFEVVFPDQAWGRDRRDFQKRGSLDDILKYVLTGTNFVARYWRPKGSTASSVTRVEIMGNLDLSRRSLVSRTGYDEVEDDEDYDYDEYEHEAYESEFNSSEDEQLNPGALSAPVSSSDSRSADSDEGEVPVAVEDTHPSSVAGMLRALAQARPAPNTTGASPAPTGDQQVQLRELTRRAHAGVKDLAEALRQAEVVQRGKQNY
ncbi:MAG: hypothetical protein QF921_00415 [Pseudomonadales bacterium]|nr:hypothetical protein [Pseudomonadales bacterium]MDP6472067.1 hypothetical protein [Pseudomonadales bacterium]MDP6826660.1 hypothetical protein [Pseudomonadales bacterium]MDP6969979.1 hypothetical protein [Pseudomonadales bacterium]